MGPSRGAAVRVGEIVNDFAQQGAAAALRPFNLQNLAGAPASEVLAALTDVLCPAGGTIDEAIARSALLETAAELAGADDVPFDALTPEALEAIYTGTIARSIEMKLFNELGSGAIVLSADINAVRSIERTLHDYVLGKVRDAFAATGQRPSSMPRAEIDQHVSNIYEGAFALLDALGGNP